MKARWRSSDVWQSLRPHWPANRADTNRLEKKAKRDDAAIGFSSLQHLLHAHHLENTGSARPSCA